MPAQAQGEGLQWSPKALAAETEFFVTRLFCLSESPSWPRQKSISFFPHLSGPHVPCLSPNWSIFPMAHLLSWFGGSICGPQALLWLERYRLSHQAAHSTFLLSVFWECNLFFLNKLLFSPTPNLLLLWCWERTCELSNWKSHLWHLLTSSHKFNCSLRFY